MVQNNINNTTYSKYICTSLKFEFFQKPILLQYVAWIFNHKHFISYMYSCE